MTTSITIAKRTDASLSEQQRQLLRGVLFEMFGGCTEDDHKFWMRLWGELMNAGSGEVFTINVSIQRDGRFHRRHMKLENELFLNQEAFSSFEQLRNYLKVGAGFCEWKVVRGQLVPEPKSISYDQCDQLTMEKFHTDAIAFLRTPRAQSELWPHLSPAMAQESIETLLSSFERQE
jgi:hypothetical protein